MKGVSGTQVTCMLPVKDLERARRFYEHGLQLEPLGGRPDGKFIYRCGGTVLAGSNRTSRSLSIPAGCRAQRTLETTS